MNPLSRPETTDLVVVPSAASTRRVHEPDPTPLRLAIGLIVAIGVVAIVWLMGYVGYRLGFSPLIRLPELLGKPGGGLVTGMIMLISVPRVVVLAGIDLPAWLMLGFMLIALPAAGISAVKPHTPGGPPPSSAAVVFSYLGAVGAGLNAAAMIWWTASSFRKTRIAELPYTPEQVGPWSQQLETIAGLDVLAVVATTVWAVLVMRLVIPGWLRALTATASFFALVVVAVAMAMSNAAVTQIHADRSVMFLDDGSIDTLLDSERHLLLGFTPQQIATLRIDQGFIIIELHDRSAMMTVIGRQSIVGMLEEAAARGASP